MHIVDRDHSRRTYALFMMMTGSFLLAVIYFSISSGSMVKRASVSAIIAPRAEVSTSVGPGMDTAVAGIHLHDGVRTLSSRGDAEHTHSHSHGYTAHMHSHPSAVHHDQVL